MRRKILSVIIAAVLAAAIPFSAFADSKDDRIAELEAQVAELTAQLEALTKSSEREEYHIGDTWSVAGQWTITVDSIEEVSERNEYADTDPTAVYLISYTYENIGYTDPNEMLDGLYIDLVFDGVIVDTLGNTGYEYPGDITLYPIETPIGATCTAQVCIGVENPGDITIHFSTFDSNSEKQTAVFVLELP